MAFLYLCSTAGLVSSGPICSVCYGQVWALYRQSELPWCYLIIQDRKHFSDVLQRYRVWRCIISWLRKLKKKQKPSNNQILAYHMTFNEAEAYIHKRVITPIMRSWDVPLPHRTQQILTCLVCAENRWEPRSDVDPRLWWTSYRFISIHKHFAIPGGAARPSVLRLCLRMAGHWLCVKEEKTKHKNTEQNGKLWGKWKDRRLKIPLHHQHYKFSLPLWILAWNQLLN